MTFDVGLLNLDDYHSYIPNNHFLFYTYMPLQQSNPPIHHHQLYYLLFQNLHSHVVL